MSSEPDARREALLPAPYEGGRVDLVAIGQRLRSALPDRVEFARVPGRYVAVTIMIGFAALLSFGFVALAFGSPDTEIELETMLIALALALVLFGLFVSRALGRRFPTWRPALERVLWLGAAVLRTLSLFVNISALVLVAVFATVKSIDPSMWSPALRELEWPAVGISIGAAVLATLLTLRRPILHIDPRWTWVHLVSTPLPSIVVAGITLLVVTLTPLIPDQRGSSADTTAIVASLASVAAVIAAIAAAWVSIGVGIAQLTMTTRRTIAAAFLDVADAARRVRVERGIEPHEARRRDELCAAVGRLANDVRSPKSGRLFAPVPADRGVVLAIEGVQARLLALPLGPSSRPYSRSIERYLGRPDEHRLVAGIEAFAREFAERARTNASSSAEEFSVLLGELDADAVRRDGERTRAAAEATATSGAIVMPRDGSGVLRGSTGPRGPLSLLRRLARVATAPRRRS